MGLDLRFTIHFYRNYYHTEEWTDVKRQNVFFVKIQDTVYTSWEYLIWYSWSTGASYLEQVLLGSSKTSINLALEDKWPFKRPVQRFLSICLPQPSLTAAELRAKVHISWQLKAHLSTSGFQYVLPHTCSLWKDWNLTPKLPQRIRPKPQHMFSPLLLILHWKKIALNKIYFTRT